MATTLLNTVGRWVALGTFLVVAAGCAPEYGGEEGEGIGGGEEELEEGGGVGGEEGEEGEGD